MDLRFLAKIEPGCLIGVGLLVVLALIGAFLHARQERQHFEEQIRRAAARLKATVEDEGIRFNLLDLGALMEFDRGGRHQNAESRIVIDLRGRSPGTFKLVPEGLGQSILKLFEGQDIRIGDERFDAAYVVRANPESLAHTIFGSRQRTRAFAAVESLRSLGRPSIDLTHDSLSFRVDTFLGQEPEMLRLVEAAGKFLECVLQVDPSAGIRWIESSSGAGGTCQVCGSEMKERVVRCAKCHTPHHEECWRYTGQCSTFACKERRFVR